MLTCERGRSAKNHGSRSNTLPCLHKRSLHSLPSLYNASPSHSTHTLKTSNQPQVEGRRSSGKHRDGAGSRTKKTAPTFSFSLSFKPLSSANKIDLPKKSQEKGLAACRLQTRNSISFKSLPNGKQYNQLRLQPRTAQNVERET